MAVLLLLPLLAIVAGVLLLAPAVQGGLAQIRHEIGTAFGRWTSFEQKPVIAKPTPPPAPPAPKAPPIPLPSAPKPPSGADHNVLKPVLPPVSPEISPRPQPAVPRSELPAAPRIDVPAPPRAAAPLPSSIGVEAGTAMATPKTPWKSPLGIFDLRRIAFGACLDQRRPQPIWGAVRATNPQLFLMMGDNVYGDSTTPAMGELALAYRDQLANPDFAAARGEFPFLSTWDDHDYGANDAGEHFALRARAEHLFRAFWQRPAEEGHAGGVYSSRTFGLIGKRVQLILLDTRSFRSAFKLKDATATYNGKYAPDPDPAKTMLGETQWAWLGEELRKRADLRIIVSSVQVIGEGHGFERWGALPNEKERLFKLIQDTGATGVILLSGDRHMGAIYNRPLGRSQIVPEVTSSSLNAPRTPQDLRTPELVSELHGVENFGIVDIDWEGRRVALSLRGVDGKVLDSLTVKFADLGIPSSP